MRIKLNRDADDNDHAGTAKGQARVASEHSREGQGDGEGRDDGEGNRTNAGDAVQDFAHITFRCFARTDARDVGTVLLEVIRKGFRIDLHFRVEEGERDDEGEVDQQAPRHLPSFSVEPKISLYEQFPTVVLFEYDFNDCSDDELETVGESVYYFASHQLETVDTLPGNTKNVARAKNGQYFTRCQFLSDALKFYLAFQAIIDDDQELLSDFVFDPLEKIRDLVDGDAPEEVMEQDYDEEDEDIIDEEKEKLLHMNYILEVEIDASWPNSPDDYSVHFKYCYPLLNIDDNEKPYFPDFADFMGMPKFDVFEEELTFELDVRDKKDTITIRPGETIEYKFDYYNSDKKTSRRVGKVTFYLRHVQVEAEMARGQILIRKEQVELRSHKFLYEEEAVIDAEDQKKKPHSVYAGESFFTLLFTSKEGDYFVIMGGDSYEEGEETPAYYIPLLAGQKNVSETFYRDKSKKYALRTIIKFVDEE